MNKKTAAIVLAAGKGTRMGGDTHKQYMEIGGHPLIYYSLKTICDSFIDEVVLVCGKGEEDYCSEMIVEKYGLYKIKNIVTSSS